MPHRPCGSPGPRRIYTKPDLGRHPVAHASVLGCAVHASGQSQHRPSAASEEAFDDPRDLVPIAGLFGAGLMIPVAMAGTFVTTSGLTFTGAVIVFLASSLSGDMLADGTTSRLGASDALTADRNEGAWA